MQTVLGEPQFQYYNNYGIIEATLSCPTSRQFRFVNATGWYWGRCYITSYMFLNGLNPINAGVWWNTETRNPGLIIKSRPINVPDCANSLGDSGNRILLAESCWLGASSPPTPYPTNTNHREADGVTMAGANHAYLDGHVRWRRRSDYPATLTVNISPGGNANVVMDGLWGYHYSWWWATTE